MTGGLIGFVFFAATLVVLSPIDYSAVETYRLSGAALEWSWVRLFSPFVNTYAAAFLIGGAVWSAWKYWGEGPAQRNRAWGNIMIAIGALLPGIGGSSARAGFVEVLYVTELVGLLMIWRGYHLIATDHTRSIHANQATDPDPVEAVGQPPEAARKVVL